MESWVGWLGAAHLWVRAFHIIFVIFWMAGMFMLPRYLVYQHPVEPGSPEDKLWITRIERLRKIIVGPAMIMVWVLGLALAFNLGFAGNGWLHAKLAIVFLFSSFHGWIVGVSKKMARGERPVSERGLRMLNELPSLVTIVVVLLAVLRPF
ncbi:CopD family protein [Sphingosinicella xenopeptidilytica]|uniref:Protoporphyrinogen IX oxidase n=1 Tax=Sphingosinicella xenopeptidilytica TaxID=364098 RepID=A0ABW3C095_SPHXN